MKYNHSNVSNKLFKIEKQNKLVHLFNLLQQNNKQQN